MDKHIVFKTSGSSRWYNFTPEEFRLLVNALEDFVQDWHDTKKEKALLDKMENIMEACPVCDGDGYVRRIQGTEYHDDDCPSCKGTGVK